MKRKMIALLLALVVLCLNVPDPACRLMSAVELCYRPQDVRSTACVYDGANETYLRFVPSETTCTPLDYPNEPGIVYTRLQWMAECGRCKDVATRARGERPG